YGVRAWSPARSINALQGRLCQSVSTLADIGTVEPSAVMTCWRGSRRTSTSPPGSVICSGPKTGTKARSVVYPELATDGAASTTTEQLVHDGRLGVKSGLGFYDDNDQRVAELGTKLDQAAGELISSPKTQSDA